MRLLSTLVFAAVIAPVCGLGEDGSTGFQLIRRGGLQTVYTVGDSISRFTKWRRGAYLVLDWVLGAPPIFYTQDGDGIRTEVARVKAPDAGLMWVFGYDRLSNGTIVFIGQIQTAYREESPFLAWTSADGQNQRVVLTKQYFPHELAVAPDDTIWTLGYEMVNLNPKDPAVNREANALRHFSRTGTLINSALPQSQFDSYQLFRIDTGLLIASGDRVGWYGPQGKNATYTEIPFATMARTDYPGAAPAPSQNASVTLAFANDNLPTVFIGSSVHTNFVLDRGRGKWVPIEVPLMGDRKHTPMLIGGDGTQLVFRSGREAGFFSIQQ